MSLVSYVLAVTARGRLGARRARRPRSPSASTARRPAPGSSGSGRSSRSAAPLALRELPARSAAIAGGAGLGAIALTAFAIRETSGDPRDVVLAVVGTCAVLLAGAVGRGPVTRLLETAPARLGRESLLQLVSLALAADRLRAGAVAGRHRGRDRRRPRVSLAPAWLSYRYRRESDPLQPPVPGPVGPGAGGGVHRRARREPRRCSSASTTMLLRSPAVASWQVSRALHADHTRGCNGPLDAQTLGRCVWRAEGTRGRIALVGDSQAGQYTEPVVRAARRAGYETLVVTLNSCPFADVKATGTATPGADLRALQRRRARRVGGAAAEHRAPGLPLRLLRRRPDREPRARRRCAEHERERREGAALAARPVASVIERLNADRRPRRRHPPDPQAPGRSTRLRRAHDPRQVLQRQRPTGRSPTASAVWPWRPSVARSPKLPARRRSASTTSSVNSSLCSGAHAGTWTYRDVSHLTVAGSLLSPTGSVASSTTPRRSLSCDDRPVVVDPGEREQTLAGIRNFASACRR